MRSWENCFPFISIPFFFHVSNFIIEDNSGHNILELYLRKTFCLSENVHCDKFFSVSKTSGHFEQNARHFLASNRGGWPAETLNSNWGYWKSSRVNRCGGCAANYW